MITALALVSLFAISDSQPAFTEAVAVWPEGRELEMNVQGGFIAEFESPSTAPVTLRVTGSTLYRVFVNGEMSGYGPARGPHGYFRVDEWRIVPKQGKNIVAIEVAGYNSNSYYIIDQPSFIQAEVVQGDEVLAATGTDAFRAVILDHRVQKVQRYSFQRPFSEVYRMAPGQDQWYAQLPEAPVPCTVQPAVKLLPRRVSVPAFESIHPTMLLGRGALSKIDTVEKLWKDRALTNIGPKLKGYPEAELATIPSIELQHIATTYGDHEAAPYDPKAAITLESNSCALLDLGVNQSGFLGARVTCTQPTRLFFAFDEILTDADVRFERLGCVNIVTYELQPGEYTLESFEPYTLRYLKLLVLEGACTIENIYLREYVNPDTFATFHAANADLDTLFKAAVETYRQNAVDVFMDCPHRERAGWLCDSYFTARTAYTLGGATTVEHNFLENFLLPEKFEHLPEGMLPMCYPADHYDGVFIPNWALWFVVQLEEYLDRSQDRATIDALQPKLRALFAYFDKFENEDGLLEKLESWVFVEWSKANEFVQDVNYPSNMLYAAALAAAGRLYNDEALAHEAETIRETIRKQSFDGSFFVDNALRTADGKLEVTRNRSEVCQYFAFYFGTATPQTHAELWRVLRDEFGPDRKDTKAHPDVQPANAFVGNVLRLELLAREGLVQQLLDEAVDYNLYMANITGTLWENDGAYASCNHGFASHVAHVLLRDVLGIQHVDAATKQIAIRFADLDLPSCEGSAFTPDGPVALSWKRDGDTIRYTASVPVGYTTAITVADGLKAEAN